MAYYDFSRKELAFLIPKTYSKVLEIGCGLGKFRQFFTKPHVYHGIEPNTGIATQAENSLDQVYIGTYDEVEAVITESFELIVCNDVIEHMIDHDTFFQKIKQKMAHDSYIIGSIPNIRYLGILYELLIKKDWIYREAGILDKTHLRFFTKKSMIRTFEDNGFDVEVFTGVNGPKPKLGLKWLIFYGSALIMGEDTKFSQYGFRVKLKKKA